MAEQDVEGEISGGDIEEGVNVINYVRGIIASQNKEHFDKIVKAVAKEATQERRYKHLTELMKSFVNVVALNLGLGLKDKKQVIRVFLRMWNTPELASLIMKNIYDEDNDEMDEDNVPSEVHEQGKDAVDLYVKALRDGKEKINRIRLMVVGMYHVGKTSLVNNLIKDFRGKRPPNYPDGEQYPPSTEGIEMHRCRINNKGDWVLDKQEPKLEKRIEVIVESFFPSNETSKGEAMDVGQPDQRTIYERRHDEKIPEPYDAGDITEEEVKKNIEKNRHLHELFLDVIDKRENNKQKQKELPLEEEFDSEKKYVYIWDFAGQNIYYTTHHFFLNKRSIYLLLMDMTKDLDSRVEESDNFSGLMHKGFTCLDAFKFWLNSIHLYSSMQDQGEVEPTVILVGTRKDKMIDEKDDEKEQRKDELFEKALESFKETPAILAHIHDRKFLINNLDSNSEDIQKLQTEIKRLTEKQTSWEETIPAKWIQIEQALNKMRDDKMELVYMKDVEEASKQNAVHIDKEGLELFLGTQHMLGNILYFNEPTMKDSIILSPEWLIDVFKCFISHISNKSARNTAEWDDYKEFAILHPVVLNEIFDNSPDKIKQHRDDVLKYMEYLDIMAKPFSFEQMPEQDCMDAYSEVDKLVGANEVFIYSDLNTKMKGCYIVPCRLQAKPENRQKLVCREGRNTPVLCFRFKDKFMPPAFFHRLLAICIQSYEVTREGGRFLLFNGLAVFNVSNSAVLTIWYKEYVIYSRMTFITTTIERTLCTQIRHRLHKELMAILGLLPRSEKTEMPKPFEEFIQCPNVSEHNKGLLRVSQFIYDKSITCSGCSTLHQIDRKIALNEWYEETYNLLQEEEWRQLDRVPSERELVKMSEEIGKDCWLFGIELGIPYVDMQNLRSQQDCKDNNKTFIFMYLMKWKNDVEKKGHKPTMAFLKKAHLAVRKK